MDKALIEKVGLPNNEVSLVFEKWKNDSGCRNNSCNDCQGGCEGAFIAGATWQLEIQATSLRELESKVKELEAEIEKLKNINKVMNDQLMKNSVADLTGVVKDIKTQDPREQLIKELREAGEIIKIVKENVIHYTVGKDEQELDYKMSQFLAKLDLLEGDL